MIGRLKSRARALYGRAIAPRRMRDYLEKHADAPRLNIGSGYNLLAGWMNVDLEGGRNGPIHMNAAQTFPLPDNTFEAVLCEHMIEHIPEAQGRVLVREAFRVLKPGGRFRVVTPDLENMARLCTQPPSEKEKTYLDFVAKLHNRHSITSGEALNYIFYDYGHRRIYTIAELRGVLAEAGFNEIVETRAGFPAHPIFEGAEGHPNFMGLDNDAIEAFALEGLKA